jgi:hypothetical protein
MAVRDTFFRHCRGYNLFTAAPTGCNPLVVVGTSGGTASSALLHLLLDLRREQLEKLAQRAAAAPSASRSTQGKHSVPGAVEIAVVHVRAYPFALPAAARADGVMDGGEPVGASASRDHDFEVSQAALADVAAFHAAIEERLRALCATCPGVRLLAVDAVDVLEDADMSTVADSSTCEGLIARDDTPAGLSQEASASPLSLTARLLRRCWDPSVPLAAREEVFDATVRRTLLRVAASLGAAAAAPTAVALGTSGSTVSWRVLADVARGRGRTMSERAAAFSDVPSANVRAPSPGAAATDASRSGLTSGAHADIRVMQPMRLLTTREVTLYCVAVGLRPGYHPVPWRASGSAPWALAVSQYLRATAAVCSGPACEAARGLTSESRSEASLTTWAELLHHVFGESSSAASGKSADVPAPRPAGVAKRGAHVESGSLHRTLERFVTTLALQFRSTAFNVLNAATKIEDAWRMQEAARGVAAVAEGEMSPAVMDALQVRCALCLSARPTEDLTAVPSAVVETPQPVFALCGPCERELKRLL